MGLCKCPKRKVTNLFCFEHRVNVCEHCLIDNHPKCVVQSYLNWLKDSDYDPNCPLCSVSLTEGDVVRLLCYDVFHVRCLEKHFRSLPSNTAPAGYRCYSCDSPVFPRENQAGYVTEQLRDVLSKYNWARVGLCLPLIDEPSFTSDSDDSDERDELITDYIDDNLHGSTLPSRSFEFDDLPSSEAQSHPNTTASTTISSQWNSTAVNSSLRNVTSTDHRSPSSLNSTSTILSIDNLEGDEMRTLSRKSLAENLPSSLANFSSRHDPDGVDKYKRRPLFSWFRRYLKSRMLRGRSYDNFSVPRRVGILLLIGLIGLLTLIVFATKVGRRPGANDPNFDPMLNPNIHVAKRRVLPPNFDMINDGREEGEHDPLQAIRPIVANDG